MGKVLPKFPCHVEGCSGLFNSETGRKVHFGMMHKKLPQGTQPNTCNRTFGNERGRRLHEARMHKNKKFHQRKTDEEEEDDSFDEEEDDDDEMMDTSGSNQKMAPYNPSQNLPMTKFIPKKSTDLVTTVFRCQFKFCDRAFRNERGRRLHEAKMHKKKKIVQHEYNEEEDDFDEEEVDDNDESMDRYGTRNQAMNSSNRVENLNMDEFSPENGSSSFMLKDCTVQLKKLAIKNHQGVETEGYQCWAENCNRVFKNTRGRWVHFGMAHGTWKKKQKKVVEQVTSELQNRKNTIERQRNDVISLGGGGGRGYPYKNLSFDDYPLPSLEELGIHSSNSTNVVKLVILPPRESRLSLKHKHCLVPIGKNGSDDVYEVRSSPNLLAKVPMFIDNERGIDDDEAAAVGRNHIVRQQQQQQDRFNNSIIKTEISQSQMSFPIPSTSSTLPTTEDSLQCQICNAQFGCLTNLRKHLQIHPDTLPWPCGRCSECFRHQSQASIHRRDCH